MVLYSHSYYSFMYLKHTSNMLPNDVGNGFSLDISTTLSMASLHLQHPKSRQRQTPQVDVEMAGAPISSLSASSSGMG